MGGRPMRLAKVEEGDRWLTQWTEKAYPTPTGQVTANTRPTTIAPILPSPTPWGCGRKREGGQGQGEVCWLLPPTLHQAKQ